MLLKSETSDVGSRRLGVVAWLADAARPFRIVRIQIHFDKLLALVWPMVVDGAGCSTHSLVPAAVSCADAAWISCEHLPAAPPVPGGGVGVAVWATLPLRLALAILAFAPGLDEVRASCSRTDFEHDDESPASDACPGANAVWMSGVGCLACPGYVTREVPPTGPGHSWTTGTSGLAVAISVLRHAGPKGCSRLHARQDDYKRMLRDSNPREPVDSVALARRYIRPLCQAS